MITGVDLLRGLAVLLGWDIREVEGMTSFHDTNYAGQGKATAAALDKYDLVFSHIEAPDEASHQADCEDESRGDRAHRPLHRRPGPGETADVSRVAHPGHAGSSHQHRHAKARICPDALAMAGTRVKVSCRIHIQREMPRQAICRSPGARADGVFPARGKTVTFVAPRGATRIQFTYTVEDLKETLAPPMNAARRAARTRRRIVNIISWIFAAVCIGWVLWIRSMVPALPWELDGMPIDFGSDVLPALLGASYIYLIFGTVAWKSLRRRGKGPQDSATGKSNFRLQLIGVWLGLVIAAGVLLLLHRDFILLISPTRTERILLSGGPWALAIALLIVSGKLHGCVAPRNQWRGSTGVEPTQDGGNRRFGISRGGRSHAT